jgi:hypothetical protein
MKVRLQPILLALLLPVLALGSEWPNIGVKIPVNPAGAPYIVNAGGTFRR